MFKVSKTIASKYDSSVNYIIPYAKSFIEARYVRRSDNYISLYVSSHNGCKMRCKFCWLTDQKQNEFNHVNLDGYLFQVNHVLNEQRNNTMNKSNVRVNINFMARGEALTNSTIVNNYPNLYNSLHKLIVIDNDYKNIKMNISTIMPNTIKNKELFNIFGHESVNIYYSLYSVNDKFKKNWMPNAINWKLSLDKLAKFQLDSNNKSNNLVFHGTFIKGQNDSDKDVENLINEIKSRNFKNTKFNLVRFNPPKSLLGLYEETPEERLNEIFKRISSEMNDKSLQKSSTKIDRIGYDAFVSCGMFPEDNDL